MTREELNNQVNKMMSFKENESNKVIAIKKLFTSYKFIGLIISLIIYSLTSFAYTLIANIWSLQTITPSNVTEIVLSGILGLVIPLYFVYFLFRIHKISKIIDLNDINPKNSLLNNLFTLRRILKVILIIVAVVYIFDGIFYLSITSLYNSNPEAVSKYTELGLNLNEKTIKMFQEMGYGYIIYGCILSLLAYAILKAYKIFYLSIFNDKLESKPIEAYISIGLLILFGLCHFVGSLIGTLGISNPLGGTGTSDLMLNIIDLVNSVVILVTTCSISIIIFSIVKILKEINGSSNPIDDDKNVYTVNLD